jgi:hypothetical protein
MRDADLLKPVTKPALRTPRIRLASGRVFLFVLCAVFAVVEFKFLRHNLPRIRFTPLHASFAYVLWKTTEKALISLLIAGIATMAAELVVWLIVRPLVVRWYMPRPRHPQMDWPIHFHLASDERVVQEVPARCLVEGSWVPGSLVLTDQKLWFFPTAWDQEPSSVLLNRVEAVQARPPARPRFRLLRGMPDQFTLSDNEGREVALLVADPGQLLDRFQNSGTRLFLHLA